MFPFKKSELTFNFYVSVHKKIATVRLCISRYHSSFTITFFPADNDDDINQNDVL